MYVREKRYEHDYAVLSDFGLSKKRFLENVIVVVFI